MIFICVGELSFSYGSLYSMSRFWQILSVSQGIRFFNLGFNGITLLAASLHAFSKYVYLVLADNVVSASEF